jgi:hypothetical protein
VRAELCTVQPVQRGAGCVVESLAQLCGDEQCALVDTAERSAGCEL